MGLQLLVCREVKTDFFAFGGILLQNCNCNGIKLEWKKEEAGCCVKRWGGKGELKGQSNIVCAKLVFNSFAIITQNLCILGDDGIINSTEI